MNSKAIARYAYIIAIILCAYLLDAVISTALPIRIAVCTIVAVLTVCQMFDLKTAVFASTAFGVISLLMAFLFPNITSPVFMNPLVSILPRVLIGFTCFGSLMLFGKVLSDTQHGTRRNILVFCLAWLFVSTLAYGIGMLFTRFLFELSVSTPVIVGIALGIGLIAALILLWVILRNRENTRLLQEWLPSAISGGIGVLTNTLFVILFMAIVGKEDIMTKVIGVLLGINFVSEILAGVLLVPLLVSALRRTKRIAS